MALDHQGRVALISGASTGLGKALALGSSGARVALNYCNNGARAEASLEEFRRAGGEGALFRADLTRTQEVDALVAVAQEQLGLLHPESLAKARRRNASFSFRECHDRGRI